MDADTLKHLIEQGIADARVTVRGADGVHFEAEIVSTAFAGESPLDRHRRVHRALGDRFGGEIHALTLKTLTPEEAAH